jgi:hypothetical protein
MHKSRLHLQLPRTRAVEQSMANLTSSLGMSKVLLSGGQATDSSQPCIPAKRLRNLRILDMRTGLLAYHQNIDERPAHYVPRQLADLLLVTKISGYPLAVVIKPGKLYKLNTRESLAESKRRFKRSGPCIKPIALNPPDSYYVMTLQSYPEPNRDSSRHPHAAFVRECEEARKRANNA